MENQNEKKERQRSSDLKWKSKNVGEVKSRRFNVVETRKIDFITYQFVEVPCGKKRCTKCPHGPYWYARIWHGDKRTRVYIGKEFMTLNEFNLKKKIEKLEKEKKEWEQK